METLNDNVGWLTKGGRYMAATFFPGAPTRGNRDLAVVGGRRGGEKPRSEMDGLWCGLAKRGNVSRIKIKEREVTQKI